MSAKKRGKTRSGAAEAPGLSQGRAGRVLGARGAGFAESVWGFVKDLFPLRSGRRRLSVTQFPDPSLREEEGAGPFSALPLTLGIPALWAPRGGWRLEGSSFRGAGGSGEPNLRRPGLPDRSAGLQACTPPRPVTSRGLSGCGRGSSWPHLGEEVRGRAGEPAPRPGKQTLPHILCVPLPFPAPSQPGEGPSATLLPAPRGRRSLHLCRKWGPSRGHAESETESAAAALSLGPRPVRFGLPAASGGVRRD